MNVYLVYFQECSTLIDSAAASHCRMRVGAAHDIHRSLIQAHVLSYSWILIPTRSIFRVIDLLFRSAIWALFDVSSWQSRHQLFYQLNNLSLWLYRWINKWTIQHLPTTYSKRDLLHVLVAGWSTTSIVVVVHIDVLEWDASEQVALIQIEALPEVILINNSRQLSLLLKKKWPPNKVKTKKWDCSLHLHLETTYSCE